jgi:hypothetical protein
VMYSFGISYTFGSVGFICVAVYVASVFLMRRLFSWS